MKKKKCIEGGNLSWHLLPGHDHSDTLLVGPGPAGVGDFDEPLLCTQPHPRR